MELGSMLGKSSQLATTLLTPSRGNQAIITGGASAGPQGSAAQDGDNIYGNTDGGKVRFNANIYRSLITQALR
jgi:hypothetical protein